MRVYESVAAEDIPLKFKDRMEEDVEETIKKGDTITIGGSVDNWKLFCRYGWFTLPNQFVGKITKELM